MGNVAGTHERVKIISTCGTRVPVHGRRRLINYLKSLSAELFDRLHCHGGGRGVGEKEKKCS